MIYWNSNVINCLLGEWQFIRAIDNGVSVHGIVTFTQNVNSENVLYDEKGQVFLANGSILDSWCRYIYLPTENGFSVFFDKKPNSLFHKIDLSHEKNTLRGSAIHLCSMDTYETDYFFYEDKSFRIVHKVHGPKKNYVSDAKFIRT